MVLSKACAKLLPGSAKLMDEKSSIHIAGGKTVCACAKERQGAGLNGIESPALVLEKV